MPVINAEERTDLQNCMHQIISSLPRIGLMRLPRLKRSTSGRICRSVSGRFGGC